MGELLILRGETTGTGTSGVVSLDSDILYTTANYVMIPKGLKCRVWFKKVSGEGETLFTLQYTDDATAPSPAWRDIEQEKLASKGEVSIEKRRPLVLRGFTGREAFRVTYTQPVASKAYVELGVEIGDED
ncbi:MAG: hypothetical protein QXT64_00890 [Desulfurococcaceae archaeon]